jgi:hypothetical protein
LRGSGSYYPGGSPPISQNVEQRLSRFQIGRVNALGEPGSDRLKKRRGFAAGRGWCQHAFPTTRHPADLCSRAPAGTAARARLPSRSVSSLPDCSCCASVDNRRGRVHAFSLHRGCRSGSLWPRPRRDMGGTAKRDTRLQLRRVSRLAVQYNETVVPGSAPGRPGTFRQRAQAG